MFRLRPALLLLCACLLIGGVSEAVRAQAPAPDDRSDAPRAMTLVDLLNVPDVEDPRLAPSGERLAFVKETSDWAADRRIEHIWVTDRTGGEPIQLTNGDDGERSPRWSPDGTRVAFLADRSDSLDTQVYLIRPDGGEAQRLSDHPTAVSDIQWSPTGRWIYFRAEIEPSDAETAQEEAGNDVYAFNEDYHHRHLWRVDVESDTETAVPAWVPSN